MRNKKIILSKLAILSFFLVLFSACDDDPVSSDPADLSLEDADGLVAVVIKSQESGSIEFSLNDSDYSTIICYADGECDEKRVGGSLVSGEGSKLAVHKSDEERTVVGVSVNAGIGGDDDDSRAVIIVAEGDYDEDAFISERFTIINEFYRTDLVKPGDEVSFEIGEVD